MLLYSLLWKWCSVPSKQFTSVSFVKRFLSHPWSPSFVQLTQVVKAGGLINDILYLQKKRIRITFMKKPVAVIEAQ